MQLVFGGQSCAQFPWTQSPLSSGRLPDEDDEVFTAPEDEPPDEDDVVAPEDDPPDDEPPDDEEVEGGFFPLSVELTVQAMAARQGSTKAKVRECVMPSGIAIRAPGA